MTKLPVKKSFSIELSWVITYAIIAYFITTDIYTPSMPSIARDFAVGEDLVQMSMVLFMVGSFLSTFVSGALAENFGRRRLFVGGQVLAVVSAILCVLAPNIYILLVARFFMGLGGAVATVIGFSAVQDVYSPKESFKIFAIMGSAFAIVPAVAPILGGYLDVWFGWRANFVASLIFLSGSLLASVIAFRLPPKNDLIDPSTLSQIIQKYKGILIHKRFWRYGLVNSILISAEWCYITILPFYFIQVIGVTSPVYGYYLGAMLLCYGAGSYLAGRFIDLLGHDMTLIISMVFSIVGGFGLIAVHFWMPLNPALVALCIGLCFMGQGVSFTPSITKTLEPFTKNRASASSVRSSMNALFAMIGTAVASALNDLTLLPVAIYVIVFPLLGIIAFRTLK